MVKPHGTVHVSAQRNITNFREQTEDQIPESAHFCAVKEELMEDPAGAEIYPQRQDRVGACKSLRGAHFT